MSKSDKNPDNKFIWKWNLKRSWKWVWERESERTYRESVGRRSRGRRREIDVEGHGAAESRTEMLVPLVVPSKHLRAADLTWLRLHFSLHFFALWLGISLKLYTLYTAVGSKLRSGNFNFIYIKIHVLYMYLRILLSLSIENFYWIWNGFHCFDYSHLRSDYNFMYLSHLFWNFFLN